MTSKLKRAALRAGALISPAREKRGTLIERYRPLARRFLGNPAFVEGDHASGAVLWTDPLIVHTTISTPDPTAYMRGFASRIPSDPACFLIYLSWSVQAGAWAATIAREFALFRRSYPQHELIILCNEPSEVDAFNSVGEAALLINHNIGVSEAFFFPIDDATVEFDAVCNARFSPQKGVHLAAKIDRVAYVTRQIAGEDPVSERRIFEEVARLAPRHQIINDMIEQKVVPLTVDEVNATYNRAAVGLCLSEVEGQMLSSMEYMLAGLPIVSIPNRGGRDLFFDTDYCLTVEPDAAAIRDAVATLKERRIPRDHIRRKTLEKLAPQREAFIALIDNYLARRGVARRLSGPWPWITRRNFSFWGSIDDHLNLAARHPPTSEPIGAADMIKGR